MSVVLDVRVELIVAGRVERMRIVSSSEMAQIEGEILIRRPVEEVFDFVADERNEPSFNERMLRADLVTPEPIGAGSRFLVASTMMRRMVEMTVEFTAFQRPRLLGSTSRSVTQGRTGRPLVIVGSLTFDPVPEGTRMRWSWQIDTPGVMNPLRPLVERMGRRQEERVWASLKRLLEDQGRQIHRSEASTAPSVGDSARQRLV